VPWCDETFQVQLARPASWSLDPSDPHRFITAGTFLLVSARGSGPGPQPSGLKPPTLAFLCSLAANHVLKPFGTNPPIQMLLIQGHEGCLIMAVDQQRNMAELVVRFPTPRLSYEFLTVDTDVLTMRQVIPTIRFTDESWLTWAQLDRMHPVLQQSDGLAPLAPDPGAPHRLSYCVPGAIRSSTDGGVSWSDVSVQPAVAASLGTDYPIVPLGPNPQPFSSPVCDQGVVDPGHQSVAYASFDVVRRRQVPPPFYRTAYQTLDGGRHWQTVPVPAGATMGDFGGFAVVGPTVEAIFYRSDIRTFTLSPAQIWIVEKTTDGGLHWTTGNQLCPSIGPCATWSPARWANCAGGAIAAQWVQYSQNHGSTWAIPLIPDVVHHCLPAHLVTTSTGRLLFLDGSRQASPLISDDGGQTWELIPLPELQPPTGFEGTNYYGYPGLMMLPNGSLLAFTDHPQLLEPGGKSWCAVRIPELPPIGDFYGQSGNPYIVGDGLWWIDHQYEVTAVARPIPISDLSCQMRRTQT
jgi:hypothetical protein